MSSALREREQAAIKRLAPLLGVEIDPGKNQAQVLEELAGAADTLLGPAPSQSEARSHRPGQEVEP